MRCKNCGKRLRKNERFCTTCGYYNEESSEVNFRDDGDYDLLEDEEDNTMLEDDFPEDEDDGNFLDVALDNKMATSIIKNDSLDDDSLLHSSLNNTSASSVISHDNGDEDFLDEDFPQEEEYDSSLDSELSLKKNKAYLNKEEAYFKSYTGEDYKIIGLKIFNIYAAIFNWIYFLYRKMYLIGILGLIATGFVIVSYRKYFIIYYVISSIVLGFLFNKVYQLVSMFKIKRLEKKYKGSDPYTMQTIMEEKGGVRVLPAILIYFVFIVIVVLNLFTFQFNKEHNTKYWKENSENRANCLSLIQQSRDELKTRVEVFSVVEASCRITKSTHSDYEIYMKSISSTTTSCIYQYEVKNGYLNYIDSTDGVLELEQKSVNKTISEEEEKSLLQKKDIQKTYNEIYEESKKEDQLIKEKKNTKEKKSFIFGEDEVNG